MPDAFDSLTALDRLIYYSEAPVDIPEAQQLLAVDPSGAPPASIVGFDFGRLPPQAAASVPAWAARLSRQDAARADRQSVLAAYPHVAYLFVWVGRTESTVEAVVRNAIRAALSAADELHLPKPAAGLSRPVADWADLRRALTRSTVAFRIARLLELDQCGHEETERFLAADRAPPLPTAALLGALARHDRPAVLVEARRLAASYIVAYLTPIATLRTQLIRLLLACGEVARAAGVTDHQVNRWADHCLRRLWQIYSLDLFVDLVVDSVDHLADEIDTTEDASLPRAVASARSLLAATWNENLSAAELARQTGLTVPRLSRLFNRHLGCSIPAFRNRLRIKHAAQLLTDTDKSVTSIAFDCGFSSLTHFNRIFADIEGASPSQYRRLHAAGAPRSSP